MQALGLLAFRVNRRVKKMYRSHCVIFVLIAETETVSIEVNGTLLPDVLKHC